jgi:hypothetical protein
LNYEQLTLSTLTITDVRTRGNLLVQAKRNTHFQFARDFGCGINKGRAGSRQWIATHDIDT